MSKKKVEPVLDLRVLDVRKPKPNWISVNENLPSAPFNLLIISPPASGKTAILVSMVYRFYKNVFDEIYWFSPTLKLDNTLALNVREDETIIKVSDADELEKIDMYLREIMEAQQAKLDEGEDLDHVLVVLDDCLSFVNNGNMLKRLCSVYRHLKISIIVSIQKMRMLNNTLRTCCSDVISFAIPNKKQRDVFFEEYDMFPDMEQYFETCTKEKYNWIRMDFRNMALYHGSPQGITKIYQK
jgi:hypothetical protein